jgi:hypothetical protein
MTNKEKKYEGRNEMGSCLGRLLIIIVLSMVIGFALSVFPLVLAIIPPIALLYGLFQVVFGANKPLFAGVAVVGLALTILEVYAIRNPDQANILLMPLSAYFSCILPAASIVIGAALVGWFFQGFLR